MGFTLAGAITSIEIIATGKSIREYKRLRKFYGAGRWRKLKGIAPIEFSNGTIRIAELQNCIGTRHTELGRKKSRSNGSSPKKVTGGGYVVCVKNGEYPASLELRKIYQLVPDRVAATSGLVRVVDESGEDYLYPADYFVAIKLSPPAERAFQLAS